MIVWSIPLCFERKVKVNDPQTQMFFQTTLFSSPPLPDLRRIMLPLLLVKIHVAGSLEYTEKFRESASCERSTEWVNNVTYKINALYPLFRRWRFLLVMSGAVIIKFSVEEATEAQRGSRVIALIFLKPRR